MEWLSLFGLYRYDPTLFDELVLPAEVDRADFIQNLTIETAELEVIYPDPEIMRQMIGSWSRARIHVWERVALVLFKNYDPFINITRDETRTIERTDSGTRTNDLTQTDNLTRTDNLTQNNSVSAWDSASYQNREQTTNSGTVSDTGTVKNTGSISDTGSSKVTETYHLEGDSAITDAQDVARKEIELRTRYELDEYIINDFKNRFCLLVY